eukprot:4711503-Alexandrium_andersonii.AAC.1
MCIRDRRALAFPLANPKLSRVLMRKPPIELQQLERLKGCAGAWHTCPTGQLREEAQRAHPRLHQRA